MATLYYESDADPTLIQGRKVAILGYGSQGHAHALNLSESGVDVRVGLREGSGSRRKAEEAGLRVTSIARGGRRGRRHHDPAARHRAEGGLRRRDRPHLREGDALFFAHGFNIRYGQIVPPAGVDVAMVAPKSPGHLVRRTYTEGGGVPSLVAVAAGRQRQGPRPRPVLRPRPGGHPGRRARHHLQGGDRDRPLRRAGRPLRRHDVAGQGRVRHAGGRRVPAGVGVLRVPARAEADRGPHVRAGHRRHALLDLRPPPSTAT